jgi:hypothetical protein
MSVRIIAACQCALRSQFVQVRHLRIFADHILKALVFLHHNDYVLVYRYFGFLSCAGNLGVGSEGERPDAQDQKAKARKAVIGSHCFKPPREVLSRGYFDPSRMHPRLVVWYLALGRKSIGLSYLTDRRGP